MSDPGYPPAEYQWVCPSGSNDATRIATPIIFITGYGDIPMSVKAMKAGAIDFLCKPFTEKKLLNAITLAISRSKTQNKKQAEIAKIKRRIKTLSPRELEVFRFVAQGMLNKQIASKRGLPFRRSKFTAAGSCRRCKRKPSPNSSISLKKRASLPPAPNYLCLTYATHVYLYEQQI